MPEETHHLFTTLGLSGSGKTCFMAGMYYKMSAGADGYTLKTGDDEALKLTSLLKLLIYPLGCLFGKQLLFYS